MAAEHTPVFPRLFRAANRILSLFQPLAVTAEVSEYNYKSVPPKACLSIRIFEKRTGRGVRVPFTVYLDGKEVYSGMTDREGKAECWVEFPSPYKLFTIDVYVFRREFGRAFTTLMVPVFKGTLYNAGVAWWMIGEPQFWWFDDKKPTPRVGDRIWFASAIFSAPIDSEEWRNTLTYIAHVDHIVRAPDGNVYDLVVSYNNKLLAPGDGRLVYSCICLTQPVTSLYTSGRWTLTVVFTGEYNGVRVELDRKTVDFVVS